MTPAQMIEAMPYLWQDVVSITQHAPDTWHRHVWYELHLACDHSREHAGSGRPVPGKIRCYQCPKEQS